MKSRNSDGGEIYGFNFSKFVNIGWRCVLYAMHSVKKCKGVSMESSQAGIRTRATNTWTWTRNLLDSDLSPAQ